MRLNHLYGESFHGVMFVCVCVCSPFLSLDLYVLLVFTTLHFCVWFDYVLCICACLVVICFCYSVLFF